jgi:hypothetical protein
MYPHHITGPKYRHIAWKNSYRLKFIHSKDIDDGRKRNVLSYKLCFARRVREIAKSGYQLRQVCLSVCPSAWNNSAPKERIFMKFDIWGFFKSVEKIQVSLKSDKNNGYFTLRPMYIYDNVSLNSS